MEQTFDEADEHSHDWYPIWWDMGLLIRGFACEVCGRKRKA